MPAEHSIPEDKSRRTLIIVIAIVAAVLIGGVFYLLMKSTAGPPGPPARLEGAIREGSPEFEKYKKLIALDEPEADQATSVLGGLQMSLRTTVRNFTGRAITGLEMRAAVVDHQGQPVKERTVVVIPGQRDELEPNKTMTVNVKVDGMKESDDRANIKMEVTGFTLR
ncbi:MAG: hypothetical protein ACXW3C_03740 [Pyrinomonadaceae bacterium]